MGGRSTSRGTTLYKDEMRFAKVAFGVSCSPFLLNATLRHHLEKYRASDPELVDTLILSTYVDDVIFGAETEEGLCSLQEVLAQDSFNLH